MKTFHVQIMIIINNPNPNLRVRKDCHFMIKNENRPGIAQLNSKVIDYIFNLCGGIIPDICITFTVIDIKEIKDVTERINIIYPKF